MTINTLTACPDCDLLFRLPDPLPNSTLLCTRCHAVIRRPSQGSLSIPLAYSLTSLLFFLMANSHPLLTLKLGGQIQENTLLSGVMALFHHGLWKLAMLVGFTSMLAPLLHILLLLYILLPLQTGHRPWKLEGAFRWLMRTSPWSMLGVYMLGILVAMVKLRDLATIVPGLSLFFFAGLILTTTAAKTTLNPEMIWIRAETLPR